MAEKTYIVQTTATTRMTYRIKTSSSSSDIFTADDLTTDFNDVETLEEDFGDEEVVSIREVTDA